MSTAAEADGWLQRYSVKLDIYADMGDHEKYFQINRSFIWKTLRDAASSAPAVAKYLSTKDLPIMSTIPDAHPSSSLLSEHRKLDENS